MKRMFISILILLLALACLTPAALAEERLTIGIVMQKENGAFLDMKQGILLSLIHIFQIFW